MEISIERIEEAAAKEAVDQIIDEENWAEVVRLQVQGRLDVIFNDQLETEVRRHVDAAVKDGFNHAFQPIDQFGRPTGQPTTISKEFERLLSDYWTQRVDTKTGKPAPDAYRSVSRAEYLLTQICADDFHGLLKQQAVNVTASLKDGLREQLRGYVDKTLGDLFKVRSATDQEEGRRS